ncbi:MAG: hypothetical protein JO072_10395 [Parafilimonas sp.]|nr:hypothetical protein [Parafilimonas sp.]
MKQGFAFILCAICFVAACTKTSENSVLIRLRNNTSENFKEVITNGKSFVNVQSSAITSYQNFGKAIDLPYVQLINLNNDTSFAGLIYIDPPVSYLQNGKYTLEIFEDTLTYYGYNCKYIKD